jgi:hypothetical protein
MFTTYAQRLESGEAITELFKLILLLLERSCLKEEEHQEGADEGVTTV